MADRGSNCRFPRDARVSRALRAQHGREGPHGGAGALSRCAHRDGRRQARPDHVPRRLRRRVSNAGVACLRGTALAEVELRSERLKKELKWRDDLAGWEIVKPESPARWDDRFEASLKVFVEPLELNS